MILSIISVCYLPVAFRMHIFANRQSIRENSLAQDTGQIGERHQNKLSLFLSL